MEESSRYCKVCVTGGSGFIGSSLICKLLNKGVYYVHATLRNLGDTSKVSLLKELPGAEARLQLFEADIYNPDQFEAAIKDCQYVFHLATPFTHLQHSQYKDLREAAVAGTKSIIMACKRSGTVRRLIYTASVVASSALNEDHSAGLKDFLDENCWTPLHHHVVTSSVYKSLTPAQIEKTCPGGCRDFPSDAQVSDRDKCVRKVQQKYRNVRDQVCVRIFAYLPNEEKSSYL